MPLSGSFNILMHKSLSGFLIFIGGIEVLLEYLCQFQVLFNIFKSLSGSLIFISHLQVLLKYLSHFQVAFDIRKSISCSFQYLCYSSGSFF